MSRRGHGRAESAVRYRWTGTAVASLGSAGTHPTPPHALAEAHMVTDGRRAREVRVRLIQGLVVKAWQPPPPVITLRSRDAVYLHLRIIPSRPSNAWITSTRWVQNKTMCFALLCLDQSVRLAKTLLHCIDRIEPLSDAPSCACAIAAAWTCLSPRGLLVWSIFIHIRRFFCSKIARPCYAATCCS